VIRLNGQPSLLLNTHTLSHTLVHFSAQPEPILSLKLHGTIQPIPQKMLTTSQKVEWTSVSPCLPATMAACEECDACVKELLDLVDELGGVFLLTAGPGHSFPDCLLIVYRCTRTPSPRPPPGLVTRSLTVRS